MIPLIDCSPIAKGTLVDVDDKDFNRVGQSLGAATTGIGMCDQGITKEKGT